MLTSQAHVFNQTLITPIKRIVAIMQSAKISVISVKQKCINADACHEKTKKTRRTKILIFNKQKSIVFLVLLVFKSEKS